MRGEFVSTKTEKQPLPEVMGSLTPQEWLIVLTFQVPQYVTIEELRESSGLENVEFNTALTTLEDKVLLRRGMLNDLRQEDIMVLGNRSNISRRQSGLSRRLSADYEVNRYGIGYEEIQFLALTVDDYLYIASLMENSQ